MKTSEAGLGIAAKNVSCTTDFPTGPEHKFHFERNSPMILTEIDPREQTPNSMKQSGSEKQDLDALFTPETVAVIGATDRVGAVGRTVLQNLLHPSFHGKVYPVNPHRSEVLGLRPTRVFATCRKQWTWQCSPHPQTQFRL